MENRSARFKTVDSTLSSHKIRVFEVEIVEGLIWKSSQEGIMVLVMIPVFCPMGLDKSFAELSLPEKNLISLQIDH